MKKVSIITGGSSGLGFHLSSELLSKDKKVLIIGKNLDRLKNAKLKLESKFNNNIYTFSCNIGNEEDINNLENYIKSNNFSIEYLFNNAGRGNESPVKHITNKIIDETFESNLKGLILITSKILQLTPSNQHLTIINIMSTSALEGREKESVYCAAKWGARGFTESLRKELKGTKRDIIAVYPGGMKTPFWKTINSKRSIDDFMDPADVAKKIIESVIYPEKLIISDITINRKKLCIQT